MSDGAGTSGSAPQAEPDRGSWSGGSEGWFVGLRAAAAPTIDTEALNVSMDNWRPDRKVQRTQWTKSSRDARANAVSQAGSNQ